MPRLWKAHGADVQTLAGQGFVPLATRFGKAYWSSWGWQWRGCTSTRQWEPIIDEGMLYGSTVSFQFEAVRCIR